MSFIHTESYLHRAAKDVVASWLRRSAHFDGYVGLPPISLRPNRPMHPHGVWLEYPIGMNSEGHISVWDEVREEFNIEPPTVEQVRSLGVRVACVCDIVIGHKGTIGAVIEVVHKHPTPQWKLDFLRRLDIDVYEVCALRTLSQIGPPKELPIWAPKRARPR